MKQLTLFRIGRVWLIANAVIFSAIGILLAIAPDCFVFDRWNADYAEHFNPENNAQRDFLAAPIGGTIFGNFVLTGFIAWFPLRERKRWAWWSLLVSLLAWFLTDSSMSLVHGAWFNVLQINLTTLILQGIPILMTAPHIFQSRSTTVS